MRGAANLADSANHKHYHAVDIEFLVRAIVFSGALRLWEVVSPLVLCF